MKQFTNEDFTSNKTEEGYEFFACVMGNGLEIQIDNLEWGWIVGVYDARGILIGEPVRQPFYLDFAGQIDYEASNKRLMEVASRLYDKCRRFHKLKAIDIVLPLW